MIGKVWRKGGVIENRGKARSMNIYLLIRTTSYDIPIVAENLASGTL